MVRRMTGVDNFSADMGDSCAACCTTCMPFLGVVVCEFERFEGVVGISSAGLRFWAEVVLFKGSSILDLPERTSRSLLYSLYFEAKPTGQHRNHSVLQLRVSRTYDNVRFDVFAAGSLPSILSGKLLFPNLQLLAQDSASFVDFSLIPRHCRSAA